MALNSNDRTIKLFAVNDTITDEFAVKIASKYLVVKLAEATFNEMVIYFMAQVGVEDESGIFFKQSQTVVEAIEEVEFLVDGDRKGDNASVDFVFYQDAFANIESQEASIDRGGDDFIFLESNH